MSSNDILISYTCIRYSSVTEKLLGQCSALFKRNYGIWSVDAALHSNNVLQAGTRVRLGMKRLREMLLFNDRCLLVIAEKRSFDNEQRELIGHAFGTWARYEQLHGNAVWITQLVVGAPFRRQGIAGTLISMAKNSIDDVVTVGVASSHPYTVFALCNACNRTPIDLEFLANHGEGVVRACNVPYLSDARLVGSIFNTQCVGNIADEQQPVSLVNTDFFVDHQEVLVALQHVQPKWILGPLLEGHEFFIVLPTTSVRSSRTSRLRDSALSTVSQ